MAITTSHETLYIDIALIFQVNLCTDYQSPVGYQSFFVVVTVQMDDLLENQVSELLWHIFLLLVLTALHCDKQE